jgi:hypothetical protein
MVNADGAQDLFIFALTRNGRVETTNYRTVKLPSDADVPEFVKDEFGDFYRDMFTRSVRREDGSAVFLEYAWDMAWCDPCAADPMSREELGGLGVFWLDPGVNDGTTPGGAPRWIPPSPGGQAQNVFVTRLHVRYDAAHFPEDLALQETGDRTNFQGRFVLHHPWKGESDCPAMAGYKKELRVRQAHEAETLASLTGWDLDRIYRKMRLSPGDVEPAEGTSWWDKMWKGGSR